MHKQQQLHKINKSIKFPPSFLHSNGIGELESMYTQVTQFVHRNNNTDESSIYPPQLFFIAAMATL
jgi:hypothetical protein